MRRATYLVGVAMVAITLALLGLAPQTASTQEPRPPEAPAQSPVLDIPIGQAAVDGECAEYGSAAKETITYPDGSTATVYLQHDGSNLFVCLDAPSGTYADRFASLYLDPQGDGAGYVFAQKDDYGLWVEDIPGVLRRTVTGTGIANGWVGSAAYNGYWDGVATVVADRDIVEWRADLTIEGFAVDECEYFGIAVYHHWFSTVGDDHGWPSSQWFDQPRTWQLARIDSAACDDPQAGTIAYVYRGDTADTVSFFNLLTGAGYTVDLVQLNDIVSTNFAGYDLIIIADDTGYLDSWGVPALTAAQVAQITAPSPGVPIIGLGEGGYAFFGELGMFIGWPNGWHGPQNLLNRAPLFPAPIYNGVPADPVQVYANPVNEVGIYLGGGALPVDVQAIGMEPVAVGRASDHASLIRQNCYTLWGFSGNAFEMTAAPAGELLFLNTVAYMAAFQCGDEEPPPEDCASIVKTANPPAGTPVQPGDTIEYTIEYEWSNSQDCRTSGQTTRIIDYVPPDTFFVPGTATDGIGPQADGALVWQVTPGAGLHEKKFTVVVADSQCFNQSQVYNVARLLVPGGTTLGSIVTHPVECPDLTFPNEEPPYAETEIQIHPYPLVSGEPSDISVKVSNNGASAKTVVVRFQTSPNKFGIGLDFNTFSTKVVTIPAHSNVIVQTTFTPVVPGHYCIQVVVQGTDPGDPEIKTQKNIDVTEDLQPGVPDDLDFKVGNPTAATADINLVVINTCPGWTAYVTPALIEDLAPGDTADAALTVIPPNPVTLGTACTIDVQGWIDTQLIGGIRKIDVPPVHLPVDVEPPYMEPEISVNPDPPVAGQAGQICVELQNPLAFERTVTLDFAVADFGAGIWFTPVGNIAVTLPPNSIDDYCISWTPDPGGTLHRCIMVTLSQPGYQDQHSQRNINIVKGSIVDIMDLDLPLLVRNPDFGPHLLEFDVRTYGLGPGWRINLIQENGQPLPDMIGPGMLLPAVLQLQPVGMMAAGAQQAEEALPAYGFGDETRIEVDVLMDGVRIGGVAYVLDLPDELFLPLISR